MRALITAVAVALLLGACGGGETETDVAEGPLTPDGDWQLVSGVPLLDGYPITLSIAGSEAGGRAACNSYGASVAVAGDTITFGELSGTEMGCEPDVMGADRGPSVGNGVKAPPADHRRGAIPATVWAKKGIALGIKPG